MNASGPWVEIRKKKSDKQDTATLQFPEDQDGPQDTDILLQVHDSLLSGSIAVYCVSSTTQDLYNVFWSDSESITESSLPNLQDNRTTQSETKANKIITDPCHPNSRLFSLLQSEKA